MRLTDEEKAMLAGKMGAPRRLALEHQVKVGRFFDAADMVPVSQVHIMADTEALGEAGVEFVERIAAYPEAERRTVVPTVTDPRGADFNAYKRLRQQEEWIDQEGRVIEAFQALGVLMTDTCINYQTVIPPVLGEHVAFGDTGSSIYTNSVLGARTNFEGGPSALAAALTGRTPRYGFHLDECRRGKLLYALETRPQDWADWGAVGGIVGRGMDSYWTVPVIAGVNGAPTSDELKHFGAALASFGSTPLFHMIGVTPEAPAIDAVFDGPPPTATRITRADIDAFYDSYGVTDDRLDVVVFAAPQLSLFELQRLGRLLDGRQVNDDTTLIAATSPENKSAADRMGITQQIEDAGGLLLEGVCFYQMHAREIGDANGWRRLMSNSAKIVNILGGYGYEPVLATMERCVDCAVAGRIVR
jgi:predicted aconitase